MNNIVWSGNAARRENYGATGDTDSGVGIMTDTVLSSQAILDD